MDMNTIRTCRYLASWVWFNEDEIMQVCYHLQQVFSEMHETNPRAETRTNIRRLESYARSEPAPK